jgi:hypothetical protein
MAQQNRLKPLTEPGERSCASSGKQTLRFYYHELSKAGRIGTSYFWCPSCHKTAHSSGPRLSERFTYDDPFSAMNSDEFGVMETLSGWSLNTRAHAPTPGRKSPENTPSNICPLLNPRGNPLLNCRRHTELFCLNRDRLS